MDKSEILQEMQDIFIDVLDNTEIKLVESIMASDIEEWDSLSHIQLIVAIEKHFKIKLSAIEIMECENVGDMVDCIKRKLT